MTDIDRINLLCDSGYFIKRIVVVEYVTRISFVFSGTGNPIQGERYTLITDDVEAIKLAHDILDKQ
jgi:hypothetical protein